MSWVLKKTENSWFVPTLMPDGRDNSAAMGLAQPTHPTSHSGQVGLKWMCCLKINAKTMQTALQYCDCLTQGFLWGPACCQHFALTLLTGNSSCGSIFSSLVCFSSPENHIEHSSHLCQLPLCKWSHKASLISQASPRGHWYCFGAKHYQRAHRNPGWSFELRNRKAFPLIGSSGNLHMTD